MGPHAHDQAPFHMLSVLLDWSYIGVVTLIRVRLLPFSWCSLDTSFAVAFQPVNILLYKYSFTSTPEGSTPLDGLVVLFVHLGRLAIAMNLNIRVID